MSHANYQRADLEWWHQHNSKMLKRIIKLSLET